MCVCGVYACMCVCVSVRVCERVSLYVHACAGIRVCMSVFVRACERGHALTCAFTCTYERDRERGREGTFRSDLFGP